MASTTRVVFPNEPIKWDRGFLQPICTSIEYDGRALVKVLRRASVAVYIAAEEGPATDLSDMLKQAADLLDAGEA